MTRQLAIAALACALLMAGCAEDGTDRLGAPVTSDEARQAVVWRTLRNATLARTEVAAARIGDHAYVVGGFAPPAGETSAVLERYDLKRNRWTRRRPIPQAVNHAAAVAYRGDLYVLGGFAARTGLADETRAFWRYRPRTNRWTRMSDAPSARGALAAGVIGDRLYAIGGARSGTALATLEVYDFRRRRWSTGRAMPTAREHLAAAVRGRALYVLAGRAAGQGNFDVVERYTPATRRWRTLAPMRRPRGGIAAATVADQVVVAGGEEDRGTIAEVEAYDPRGARWRLLPALPTPRHGLGAVAHEGRIVVLEGGPEPGLTYSRSGEALRVPRASASAAYSESR